MLLTLRTTHVPATDLGHLLHKHPERLQTFELPFGQVHVFYPEVSEEACTAVLLLDVDPVGLVRGEGAAMDQYVNDRPYVASSFLSVAIARVLGQALGGRAQSGRSWRRRRFPWRPGWPCSRAVAARACSAGSSSLSATR